MGLMQRPGAVVTRDGARPPRGVVAPFIGSGTSAAALRPFTGSEVSAIGTMWERCSPATRVARFHAPVRDIPASYLKAALTDLAASILAVREPGGDVVALASL